MAMCPTQRGCEVTFLLVLGGHLPPAEALLDNMSRFYPWKTQGDSTQSGFAAAHDRIKPASSLAQRFPFTNFRGWSSLGAVESLNQEPEHPHVVLKARIADLPHEEAEPAPSVPSWSF